MQRFRTRFRWPLISVPEAPPATDPNFANVVLLLHMNGANGSTTFTDNSSSAHVVTPNNNVQISTAQSKFGGASGLFDGVSDYLSLPFSGNWQLSDADFTVECFVRPISWLNADAAIVGNYSGASAGHWVFQITGSGSNLQFRHADSIIVTQAATVNLNEWSHIAASRQSGTLRMFVNGVQLAADASFTANFSQGTGIGVGSLYPSFPNDSEFNGYMDELRITKGVARYTANFTPPTAAFPNS